MAPVRIDASHFSPDTRDFIGLLHSHEVRYLIVGGEAVIFHGHARLTGDVDFFFGREPANLERLFAALDVFWDGDVPGLTSAADLSPDGTIVQFGQPPNRIDLINAIEGVGFEEAWGSRVEAVLTVDGREIPVPFIGIDALLKNKRAVGRPKDLDDLSYLGEGE
ncbi:MAG TPA: DUF6036 family nucleotidyltransferase [Longimicrobiales bacterium]|nr:DUF6036 family nucleotidyltransferase [Longimicrobiales bacterium]